MSNIEEPTQAHRCMIRRSQCTVVLISLLQGALSVWWLFSELWIPGSILLFFALCGLIGAARMRAPLVLLHFIGSTILFMLSMYSFITFCMAYEFHWSTFLIGLGIILVQLGGLGHDRRLFFFARMYGPLRCGTSRCSSRRQQAQQQQQPEQTPLNAAPQEVVIESLNEIPTEQPHPHHHNNLVVPDKRVAVASPQFPAIQQAPAPQFSAPMPPTNASESQQPMMFPAMMPNGQVQYFMWVPMHPQQQSVYPPVAPQQLQYPQLYPTITSNQQ